MIEIGPSRLLRLIVFALWALGALLIELQQLVWSGLGQLLWAMGSGYWVYSTCGLNERRLRLQTDRREARLVADGESIAITEIRPGIINGALVSAEIRAAGRRYAILATKDNVPREAHRRLRRFLLANA